MSDKELDDLFKEASGKMDTPFESSDWQKMEKLLDASGGTRGAFWNWKTYSSLSLLLLLGTGASVIWLNSKNEQRDVTPQQEHIATENKLSSSESNVEQESNEGKIQSTTPQIETTSQGTTIRQRKKEINKLAAIQNDRGTKIKGQSENTNDVSPLLTDDADEPEVDNRMVRSDALPVSALNENPQQKNANDATGSSAMAIVSMDDEPEMSSDSVTKVNKEEQLNPNDSSADKADERKVTHHSFSLKAALSPDFSSVGYFTPGETGFNYGILAEYGLGEHFSVLLGGIWSKKLYSSEAVEAYAYGQTGNSKKITGDCRILDIPILVNYYINPGSRFVVYGSLGLSSYIMFKESYNYEVVKNGKSYDYSTTIERKNNEWLKMANIAFGMQYRLTNQWSLQVEPFVKAPLTGIGEGDIKLVSSGVFVNVKYTFK